MTPEQHQWYWKGLMMPKQEQRSVSEHTGEPVTADEKLARMKSELAYMREQQEQDEPVDDAKAAVAEIMEQAQVFASAWSLFGGRFDGGSAMDDAEEAKSELRVMVASLANVANPPQPKQEQGEPVAEINVKKGYWIDTPFANVKSLPDGFHKVYTTPQPKQEQKVPEGYKLVMVPIESPADEPDWDECIRQAEVSTGLKVERNTLSIVIREVRRWLIAKQEQGEPVSFDAWYGKFHSFAGKSFLLYSDLHCAWQAAKLYTTPPQGEARGLSQQQRKPQDWSVFNTGAEVASGLTFDEACDYLTDERLARGWSAVCVVNKDNLPIEAAHGIKE